MSYEDAQRYLAAKEARAAHVAQVLVFLLELERSEPRKLIAARQIEDVVVSFGALIGFGPEQLAEARRRLL
jgi:hypothetical protein